MIPYLICVKSKIKNKKFYGDNPIILINNFIDFLFKEKIVTIFFHYLNFDGKILLHYLMRQDLNIVLINNNNLIYGIKLSTKNTDVTIKCSYRIIPLKVKKIAEHLNFTEKKELMPFDEIKKEHLFKKIIINNKIFDVEEEMTKYCFNDCEIIRKALDLFINEILQ